MRVVPWVLGAALAIRREAFNAVGGFESAFFMYFEEVDLCYRLRAAGWEVHFASVATIVHLGGASTSQHRPQMLRQVFASAAAYYRRHFSKGSLLALRVIVIGLMLGRLVRDAGMLMLPQNMARRQRLRENMLVWPYILSDARSHWNHND
jgi:GT2 family glycosyltransferase